MFFDAPKPAPQIREVEFFPNESTEKPAVTKSATAFKADIGEDDLISSESNMVFGDSNNLDGSDVDKACGTFANEIAGIVGEDSLVEFTVDLTSDDGLKDYGMIQRKMRAEMVGEPE